MKLTNKMLLGILALEIGYGSGIIYNSYNIIQREGELKRERAELVENIVHSDSNLNLSQDMITAGQDYNLSKMIKRVVSIDSTLKNIQKQKINSLYSWFKGGNQ